LARVGKKVCGRAGKKGKTDKRSGTRGVVPEDVQLLPRKQREQINEWCNQVPIVGFNSGGYDLNLIKKYFVEKMAEKTKKIKVAKKGNKTMFMHTEGFRFLDIINYLGPATSYDKWVKAYGRETEKSWFPYEWFDSPEKLDFERARRLSRMVFEAKGRIYSHRGRVCKMPETVQRKGDEHLCRLAA